MTDGEENAPLPQGPYSGPAGESLLLPNQLRQLIHEKQAATIPDSVTGRDQTSGLSHLTLSHPSELWPAAASYTGCALCHVP